MKINKDGNIEVTITAGPEGLELEQKQLDQMVINRIAAWIDGVTDFYDPETGAQAFDEPAAMIWRLIKQLSALRHPLANEAMTEIWQDYKRPELVEPIEWVTEKPLGKEIP